MFPLIFVARNMRAKWIFYIIFGFVFYLAGYFSNSGKRESGVNVASPSAEDVLRAREGAELDRKELGWSGDQLIHYSDSRGRRLKLDEFEKYLNGMRESAGMRGLTHMQRELLGEVYVRWYQADSEDAMRWLRKMDHIEDKVFFMGQASNILDDQHASEVLNFVMQQSRNGALKGGVFDFAERAMSLGQENFEELILATMRKVGFRHGQSLKFPKEFDFRSFLDRFDPSLQKIDKDSSPANYPGNLIEEWVKRDVEAAYEWFLEMEDLETGRAKNALKVSFSDVFDGFYEVANGKESSAFLVDHLQRRDFSGPFVGGIIGTLSDKFDDEEFIEGFYESLEDAGLADSFPLKMLMENRRSGRQFDQARLLVFQRLSGRNQEIYLEQLSQKERVLFRRLGGVVSE